MPGRDDEAASPVGDPSADDVDEPGHTEPGEQPDSGTGYGDRDDQGIDRRDDTTQLASEERRRKTVAVSAITAAVGLWVAISVFLLDAATASIWNNVLVGLLVLLAAGYNVYRLSNDVPLSIGVSTLVALLGIWLIVAAALLEMLGGLFWSTLASGLLIAGLAGYNAYEAREAQAVTQPTQ
ncbi:SPW repeat domain-containing protein [Natrarchaeobaculum aegyptiacum]|uniref:SPW repeat-containing integral membrane domain-containing protein n=1 Tax=Natrarchaeobaculum aegyptiacum TaxID=745377 RepID=A0A2Z2I1R8_9EURY|nr:hypothetical protein B1756_12585 [Natrarchaeobaculum aegyptiacum]